MQCATGVRPFYIASIPVSPSDTTLLEQTAWEAAKQGGTMSGGTIAGIVVGVIAALALIIAIAAFAIKKRRHDRYEFAELPVSAQHATPPPRGSSSRKAPSDYFTTSKPSYDTNKGGIMKSLSSAFSRS